MWYMLDLVWILCVFFLVKLVSRYDHILVPEFWCTTMVVASGTCCWASALSNPQFLQNPPVSSRSSTICCSKASCSAESSFDGNESTKRRLLLVGAGTLACSFIPPNLSIAEEVPKNYRAFVDKIDGYTYYYPADWRDFDFLGHDSAFKDRNVSLQHVRVNFIPTDKSDIHDLGPMEEVIPDLVKKVYAAPIQMPTILGMQERRVDGRNYWTFEYELRSPNFARNAFATIGIANGRYYTLVVGANERRWRRVRDKMKVIADSFKMLDI